MESSRTILIVDDIAMFRELESVFLARCGRVVTAGDAATAMALAEELEPDVIVLDTHLPDLPGTALCRELKNRPEFQDTPIVLITADGSAEEHAAAIHAGADDVLSKPLDRISFVETVQRFIRFEIPRGLPRVTLRTQVRIDGVENLSWATARNVSRGGMFIEAEGGEFSVDQELQLEFELPECGDPLATSARVIWNRDTWNGYPPGAGVRFVDLEAPVARALEDYVHERAPDRFGRPGAQGGAA